MYASREKSLRVLLSTFISKLTKPTKKSIVYASREKDLSRRD
jgi:hypothetical protein